MAAQVYSVGDRWQKGEYVREIVSIKIYGVPADSIRAGQFFGDIEWRRPGVRRVHRCHTGTWMEWVHGASRVGVAEGGAL